MQDHGRVGAILEKGYILVGYIALVKSDVGRFVADTPAAKEKDTCIAQNKNAFYSVQNGVKSHKC
jgi:hypothetical protein